MLVGHNLVQRINDGGTQWYEEQRLMGHEVVQRTIAGGNQSGTRNKHGSNSGTRYNTVDKNNGTRKTK